MVVVPHRPWYRAAVFCFFLVTLAVLSFLTFHFGRGQGLELKEQVIREKRVIESELEDSRRLIARMRQEIADLKLGGEIDSRANIEVQQTVESLQSEIVELGEEIRFYKGVMAPTAEDKGLRIERLDVKATADPSRIRYNLLLTQVVDKHEYVQGAVDLVLVGNRGLEEVRLDLAEVGADQRERIRFRFRYFQNIEGELTIPVDFEPREIRIVAEASGRGAKSLERVFPWNLGDRRIAHEQEE